MAISLNFMFNIYKVNKNFEKIERNVSGYNVEKSHHVIIVVVVEYLL